MTAATRPQQPRLGAAPLVEHEGRLLLAQSAKKAIRGLWVIPGGGVEFGEEWQHTAVREIRDETGLAIELTDSKPVYVANIISATDHRVVLYTPARVIGSTNITLSSELLAARFCTREDITGLITDGVVTEAVTQVLTHLCWTL